MHAAADQQKSRAGNSAVPEDGLQQPDQRQTANDIAKQRSQPSGTQVGVQHQQQDRTHASVTKSGGSQQEAGAAARVNAIAENGKRKKSTPYLNISKRTRDTQFTVRLSASRFGQKDFTGRLAIKQHVRLCCCNQQVMHVKPGPLCRRSADHLSHRPSSCAPLPAPPLPDCPYMPCQPTAIA